VQAGQLTGAAEIGVAVSQVIGKYKVAKEHFAVTGTAWPYSVGRTGSTPRPPSTVSPSQPASWTRRAW
jgi:hypothetical protein